MIKEYFAEYRCIYHEKKKALKRYINAKEDFLVLSGTKYDDMPKAKTSGLGFDDLMINIEELHTEWIRLESEYKRIKNKCLDDIHKMKDPLYESIIEYAYLDFENDKEILNSLNEYHNVEYTLGYFRILKSKATKCFKNVITKDNNV